MFSSENGAPDSASAVLLLPLLITFFAIAARISAVQYLRTFGKRKNHRWIVYGLLAVALLLGFEKMFLMFNPDPESRYIYMNTLITRKVKIAHYLAFFIPLLTTFAIVMYDRKQRAALLRR